MRLSDIGERKLTEQLLPTVCAYVGDDCAYQQLGGNDLVITTDPVPLPAANVIAGDKDPYWAGRLLVTINASDLSAAGASPLAFVAAVECPPEMLVDDLQRFLLGVSEGCASEGMTYVGGNLKEAKTLAATGTAIGFVPRGRGLHRKGAEPEDLLYSIGRGGEFWRDAFRWRAGERFDPMSSKLFAPKSQLVSMRVLRENFNVKCSMDNSDGLLATLDQLSRINGLRARINITGLSVSGVPSSSDAARFWFGWGDWNVIIGISPDDRPRFEEFVHAREIPTVLIGRFEEGEAVILLIADGRVKVAPRLESERFAEDSWFSKGIGEYIARLNGLELP